MSRYHGQHGYGPVIRLFHWLTAVLIAAVALRGVTMVSLPATSEAEVAAIFSAYSLHKTAGIAAFAAIALRLVARLLTTAPGPLHPERRVEVFVARATHLVLWGGMILIPLSGWLRHASAPGFAPILWPFGQGFPGIPSNEALSLVFQTFHLFAGWTLAAAFTLHLLGAAKHAVLDRDATLARITTGAGPYAPAAAFPLGPLIVTLLIWAGVTALAMQLAPAPMADPFAAFETAPEPAAPAQPAPAPGTPSPALPEPDGEPIDMPPPPAD